MSSLFWISYALLWVTVAVTGVLVFLLLREIGKVYLAQSSSHARDGVEVGKRLPDLRLRTADGNAQLSDLLAGADHAIVLAASSDCGLCPEAAETVGLWVGAAPALGGAVLVDGDGWESYASDTCAVAQLPDGALNRQLELRGTPFAYLVDRDLTVLSKGVVNHEGHIAMLLRESNVEALVRMTQAPLDDSELVTVVGVNGDEGVRGGST
jgi:hypothetical protein